MPVRLNTIPDAEPYPVPPARIKWLTALLLMLSVGVALTSLFASDELAKTAHISGAGLWRACLYLVTGRFGALAGIYHAAYSCRCLESTSRGSHFTGNTAGTTGVADTQFFRTNRAEW